MKKKFYKITVCLIIAALLFCFAPKPIAPITHAEDELGETDPAATTSYEEEPSSEETSPDEITSEEEITSVEEDSDSSDETPESEEEETTSVEEPTTPLDDQIIQLEDETTAPAETIPVEIPEVITDEFIEDNLLETTSVDDGTTSRLASVTVVPKVTKDFRFTQIKENPAVFIKNGKIYEAAGTDERVVGTIGKYGSCNILMSVSEEWSYIESGLVRGFVRNDVISQKKKQLKKINPLVIAIPSIPVLENKALAYTQTTTRDVVAEKIFLLARTNVNVLDKKAAAEDATVIGTLSETNLAYLLSDEGDGWYYIESDDVRGFVMAADFYSIEQSRISVEKYGEYAYDQAEELVTPTENKCLYYTLKSARESGSTVSSNTMIWPLPSEYNYISSWFGARDDVVGENFVSSGDHNGIDMPAPEQTPIYAVLSGTVVINVNSDSAGNYLVIDHGNGLYTEYMHMYAQSPYQAGEEVSQGQIIGFVGSTGWSTGDHLHFGVMSGGLGSAYRVDPAPYLNITSGSNR